MITGTTQRHTLGLENLYLHAVEKAPTYTVSKVDVPTSTVELSHFDLGFGKCNSLRQKGFAQSLFSHGFFRLDSGVLCLGLKRL